MLPGGAGLGHAGGYTVLVGLAAPGDLLRVRIEKTKGKTAFASLVEVVRPSPQRVAPPCPYFGRCGGCDFQQLDYSAQLDAKVEIIRDCLRRIARLETLPEIPVTPAPRPWEYRGRAQWQHDPERRRLGYFERGSHRVCDVAKCPVLVPALQETLDNLRSALRDGRASGDVHVFQAVAGDTGVSVSPAAGGAPAREVSRRILGHDYAFSADGFFQINHDLLPALITAAINDARGQVALDLYCGAGLFTLPLADRFRQVTGVEANAAALSLAARNLGSAGLNNARLACAPVGEWLDREAQPGAAVDFVLVDPPRTGLEDGVAHHLSHILRPAHIAYVSCDPATLARDLKVILGNGYEIESIRALDMFPQTHHVETVVHLKRGGSELRLQA